MRIGEFELRDPVPELRRPIAIAMLRPWIDVGRVGTLALNILQRHLGAQELGRLVEPGKFFDFTRYRPRMRTVNGQRVFHHSQHDHPPRARRCHGPGLPVPAHTGAAMRTVKCTVRRISDVLSHFDIREYCRIGGMYDSVPHTRPLLVTGTMNDDQAAKASGLVSQRRSTYQGPTSIVNMVSDLVTQGEIPTTSLMAHLPQYMQLDEDHMGAARIVEILTAMFDLPASLADRERGRRQYEDVNRAVENNPEVRSLIGRLESYYDRVLAAGGQQDEDEEEAQDLPPGVEQFLREVTGEAEEDDSDDDSNS